MHAAASYLFGSIIVAALSVATAKSEDSDPPWKKFCENDVCFVGKGGAGGGRPGRGWLPDCGFAGALTLVERKTRSDKHLSLALPGSLDPERVIRITIDDNAPIRNKAWRCDCACWVGYYEEESAKLLERLKRGRHLVLEAVSRGQPHIAVIPLTGFAAAYDGPPTEWMQLSAARR
ncbi:MAG: invasion associated locus B family protein [Xanthobacteraceae bacterium]|nr:invasion associated locus B family protein [Xanthobacteraceae bacterium]